METVLIPVVKDSTINDPEIIGTIQLEKEFSEQLFNSICAGFFIRVKGSLEITREGSVIKNISFHGDHCIEEKKCNVKDPIPGVEYSNVDEKIQRAVEKELNKRLKDR